MLNLLIFRREGKSILRIKNTQYLSAEQRKKYQAIAKIRLPEDTRISEFKRSHQCMEIAKPKGNKKTQTKPATTKKISINKQKAC